MWTRRLGRGRGDYAVTNRQIRLDVAQHMSLCRHYVRELRRSVLIGTPEPGSHRSSAILDQLGEMNHPVAGPSMYATDKERDQDAQMSAFLREDTSGAQNSPHSSRHPNSSPRDVTSDSNSPDNTVNRQDIRASAEKILYTFLLPGAEREITMPDSITQDVTSAIEEYGRDDPEVFDVAKDYVFQAMERDAFPGFLRMKALGNLIPPTLVMRLVIGLVSMFGAFWTAFILIFLDKSRLTRCWVSLYTSTFPLFPEGGGGLSVGANLRLRSSFHSQSESTASHRTNTPWTQSSLSSVIASTRPSTSPGSESHSLGSFSSNGHSWSLA